MQMYGEQERVSRNCYEEYMVSLIKASKMLLKKGIICFHPLL